MTSNHFPNPNHTLYGLRGSAPAYFLAQKKERLLILTDRYQSMETWAGDLSAFGPGLRVHMFPVLPGTAYVPIPLHEEANQQRQAAIQSILHDEWDVLITQPQALLETFPAPEVLDHQHLELALEDTWDPNRLCDELVRLGFARVDMVSTPGEFAKRGAIVDVFPSICDEPIRIEFFDETIDDIRFFDPETQQSRSKTERFTIHPHFLWNVTRENIQAFSEIGANLWNHTACRKHFLSMVKHLQETGQFPGFQHWTALLFSESRPFLSLLKGEFKIILSEPQRLNEYLTNYLEQISIQENEAVQVNHIWVEPSLLFKQPDLPRIQFPEGHEVIAVTGSEPGAEVGPTDETFQTHRISKATLALDMQGTNFHRTVIFFHSQVLKNRFLDLHADREVFQLNELSELDGAGFHEENVERTTEEVRPGRPYRTTYIALPGHLSTGFEWPDAGLQLLSDRDLWPDHPAPRGKARNHQWVDEELFELKPGDLVVHEEHGIGQFEAIQEISAGGDVFEMLTLVYRNQARLHLSFSQLEKVERLSVDGERPKLDVLGGVRWENVRKKAEKSVEDLTDKLLEIYARRDLAELAPMAEDDLLQTEFEEAFEYQPTPDQLQAVIEIKRDLGKGKPMDRLVIGDVGFGKTEVAMRMMFKLVNEGFQVAMLCPTTVLAYQHYLTLKDRFQGFPIEIGFLSRLVSPKDRKKQIQAMAEGTCDILVGTHRLLSSDMVFKHLGGLVIDEEQRFGVAHKERIKELKKDVHVLSMSATPIPRTLNMALHGIRDISIMRTPPKNRLAITTTVTQYDERVIRNAIEYEMGRGGQIYFIHNEIESMPDIHERLTRLVPKARLGIAHGKMQSQELERVMLRFIRNELDILVATTLVENGMDVPNANTMLVNNAENFGLSQLYQLRGRIGRSNRPAYAYLITPLRRRLTDKAKRRLEALEEFSSLGSGFRLAALDLEIRGAGNMLGSSQSGHIQAVGYSLYMKMLRSATARLRGREDEELINPVLNLKSHAAIPKSVVEDASQRLTLYRKIVSTRDIGQLKHLEERTRDLYGTLPEALNLLFQEHRFRIKMIPFGMLSIEREGFSVRIQFHRKSKVDFSHLLQGIQNMKDAKLSPSGTLILPVKASRRGEAFLEALKSLMKDLLKRSSK